MVYIFLADGFETIEALTVADMLRRAKIECETVSIMQTKEVTSAQEITVTADRMIDEIKEQEAELLVLPGGIPGTPNLKANETVIHMLQKQQEAGRYLAAICAAPSILSSLGFLKGKEATCYPSFEEELQKSGAIVKAQPAVTDGKIITGRGMGCAIAFSAEIIKALKDEQTAQQVKASIVYEE